ncbi:hypothetical protein GCM10025857_31710 [Alicyclobacillus contaminans]|uniref:hypothetical protein n=1 Tax=Alicyclobacillus contaminans TaxID=392016 RepID=UPI00047AE537|nr:hypothetical protein [Alicyclobacillus contaminans]GMA51814.1 hypothetical protein GCM10025857_31710 [Alicyclobacillus contaminans]
MANYPKTQEELLAKMVETVEAMQQLADVLERRAQRINKSTQSDNLALEQQLKRSKLNQEMMRAEQARTQKAEYQFDCIVVSNAMRDKEIFTRLHSGWALVSEEKYEPNPTAMVRLVFAKKEAN